MPTLTMISNFITRPTSFVLALLHPLPAQDLAGPHAEGSRWSNLAEAANWVDSSGIMECMHVDVSYIARSELMYLQRTIRNCELHYAIFLPCSEARSQEVACCIETYWCSDQLGVCNWISHHTGDEAALVSEHFFSAKETSALAKQFRIFNGRASTMWLSGDSDAEVQIFTGMRLDASGREPKDVA